MCVCVLCKRGIPIHSTRLKEDWKESGNVWAAFIFRVRRVPHTLRVGGREAEACHGCGSVPHRRHSISSMYFVNKRFWISCPVNAHKKFNPSAGKDCLIEHNTKEGPIEFVGIHDPMDLLFCFHKQRCRDFRYFYCLFYTSQNIFQWEFLRLGLYCVAVTLCGATEIIFSGVFMVQHKCDQL